MKKPNQHARRRIGGAPVASLFRQRAMWLAVPGGHPLSRIRSWCRRRDAGKRYAYGPGWFA